MTQDKGINIIEISNDSIGLIEIFFFISFNMRSMDCSFLIGFIIQLFFEVSQFIIAILPSPVYTNCIETVHTDEKIEKIQNST